MDDETMEKKVKSARSKKERPLKPPKGGKKDRSGSYVAGMENNKSLSGGGLTAALAGIAFLVVEILILYHFLIAPF